MLLISYRRHDRAGVARSTTTLHNGPNKDVICISWIRIAVAVSRRFTRLTVFCNITAVADIVTVVSGVHHDFLRKLRK